MPAADAEAASPLADDEIRDLLEPFSGQPAILLAVSGGSDSFGMLAAFARWRGLDEATPVISVASIDHGLRPASVQECGIVMDAAARLGLPAATLHWEGAKPATGLQDAAREARYRLLAGHARAIGASAVATAHHREDQAETVLMRLARGSGPLGLKGMATTSERQGVSILRPFLWVPKARLAATAAAAGLEPVDDPSNADDRYARIRIRRLMPLLAGEGLDAQRLAILAGRMRMLDEALAHQVGGVMDRCRRPSIVAGTVVMDGRAWLEEPFAVVQQLLSRVVAEVAPEGARERLEAIEGLAGAVLMAIAGGEALRQTLQGALVSVTADGRVIVAREPPRQLARNRG